MAASFPLAPSRSPKSGERQRRKNTAGRLPRDEMIGRAQPSTRSPLQHPARRTRTSPWGAHVIRAALRRLRRCCCSRSRWPAAAGARAGRRATSPRSTRRIQAAVDAAQPGDLVRIGPGTYREQVVVGPAKRDVVLRGTDRNRVVLDGGDGTRFNGITVHADGVAVENLTVRGFASDAVLFTPPKGVPKQLNGWRASYVTAANNGLHGIDALGARAAAPSTTYGPRATAPRACASATAARATRWSPTAWPSAAWPASRARTPAATSSSRARSSATTASACCSSRPARRSPSTSRTRPSSAT